MGQQCEEMGMLLEQTGISSRLSQQEEELAEIGPRGAGFQRTSSVENSFKV